MVYPEYDYKPRNNPYKFKASKDRLYHNKHSPSTTNFLRKPKNFHRSNGPYRKRQTPRKPTSRPSSRPQSPCFGNEECPRKRKPSRPSSPLLGSEEYTKRKIAETSSIIMKHLLNPEVPLVKKTAATEFTLSNNKDLPDTTPVQKSDTTNSCKLKSKKDKNYNFVEIQNKIITHITKLNYGRKKNLINAKSSSYDVGIQQIQKQKRLELSQILRQMCTQEYQGSTETADDILNSIIPDIGIKIDEFPQEFIEVLKKTLDVEDDLIEECVADENINKEFITTNNQNLNDANVPNIEKSIFIDIDKVIDLSLLPEINDSSNVKIENSPMEEELLQTELNSENSLNLNIMKEESTEIIDESTQILEKESLENQLNSKKSPNSHAVKEEPTETNEQSTKSLETELSEEGQNEDWIVKEEHHLDTEIFELNFVDGLPPENSNIESKHVPCPLTIQTKLKSTVEYPPTIQTNKNAKATGDYPPTIQTNIEPKSTIEYLPTNIKPKSTCDKEVYTDNLITSEFATQTECENIFEEVKRILLNGFNGQHPRNLQNCLKVMCDVDSLLIDLTNFRQNIFKLFNEQSQLKRKSIENGSKFSKSKRKRFIKRLGKAREIGSENKQTKCSILDNVVSKDDTDNVNISIEATSEKHKQPNLIIEDVSKDITITDHVNQLIQTQNDTDEVTKTKKWDYNLLHFKELSEKILFITVRSNFLLATTENGKVYYCNIRNGDYEYILNITNVPITCLNFCKSEFFDQMFVGSFDSVLRIYNFEKRKIIYCETINDGIQCMEAKWGYIFIGGTRGSLVRYSTKTVKIEYQDKISDNNILVLKATREGARRILLVGTRNAPICVRDAMTGLHMRTFDYYIAPTVYSLLLEKSKVYCGTTMHNILVFSFHDGLLLHNHKAPNSKGISCMKVFANLLFASCHNGKIYVYNTNNNKYLDSIQGPGGVILSMEIIKYQVIVGTMLFQFKSIPIPSHILEYTL